MPARLVIGGKYGKDIVFIGNTRFLPATVAKVVRDHFGRWNTLSDITRWPQLLTELGDVRAQRHFEGTDWDSLDAHYRAHMQRYALVFKGEVMDGSVSFAVGCPHGAPAKPLLAVLQAWTEPGGKLRDSFDLWRVDKLLRRCKAQIKYAPTFTDALKVFGATAVSFEESLSFFRQVQAYHTRQFLKPELRAILEQHVDAVDTLRDPLQLPLLVQQLTDAGVKVRVDRTIEDVLKHESGLLKATTLLTRDTSPLDALITSAQLYPFQREGVAFLVTNKRALLADDMGLGKTIQAIAAAAYLKQKQGLKRALVICPASLKYQWQAEIRRFTKERVEVIGGEPAERDAIYRAAASDGGFIAPEDKPFFYVVNYELVHRDLEKLKALGADLLIVDEAQRVKNFRTKTAQAVFELPAAFVFVLTGTPLENQLMELFTIMRFIDERALGRNPIAFRERYVITDHFGGVMGYQRVEEVARKIASVTLRRTKEQTLTDLPEMIEIPRWLDLTPVQRTIYQELQGQARQMLMEAVWDGVQNTSALTLLQRLREACDSAELLDPERKDSQKVEELLSLLDDEVKTLGRQALVFTQWTRMGEILLRELTAAGHKPAFLHGGIPTTQRPALVERFQQGRDRILISTDAGGTGLNLQAASLVVNYDLPFNPAKLSQRVARAHRIGQTSTVVVVNLLSRNTVEEKLVRILNEKRELFQDVFGDISDLAQGSGQQLNIRELLRELV
jgi:SNF2 family DNA or RNA helicase